MKHVDNGTNPPKIIELDNWDRKEHFQFFEGFDDPSFSITSEVNVTEVARYSELTGESIFLCYLHATMSAVNKTDAMRLRILNNQVVDYQTIA